MDRKQIKKIDITWADGEYQSMQLDGDTAAVIMTTDREGKGTIIVVANELALHLMNKRFIDFTMEHSELAQNLLAAFALAMVPAPTASPVARVHGPIPPTF